jgi:Cu+-exporting ATPase
MPVDPVCGMTVTEDTAMAKSEYQGQTYYFCSQECKRTFVQDPEKVLKPAKA